MLQAEGGLILVGFGKKTYSQRSDFTELVLLNLSAAPIFLVSWGLGFDDGPNVIVEDIPVWERILPGDHWTVLSKEMHESFGSVAPRYTPDVLTKPLGQVVKLRLGILDASGRKEITQKVIINALGDGGEAFVILENMR